MYAKRIQLVNYGPLGHLDIRFPFEGDSPKSVLLVGENGSGKSILLSHIVNGLVSAKNVAYPDTPEVEIGKVYKLRSSSYVSTGSEYSFGRVDFEEDLFLTEIISRKLRQDYETLPVGSSEPDIFDAWNKMKPSEYDYFESSLSPTNKDKIGGLFSKSCVLYFPPNRFEDPAWLNEDNLKAQAQYMDLKHIQGQTEREVISYSPLHENQNWLFDLLYDREVLERRTRHVGVSVNDGKSSIPLPVFAGYSGIATSAYETALQIARKITRRTDARFGVGPWNDRRISIETGTGQLIPNIFQLSSGETALLNLFLSILRDFALCGGHFSSAADVRGIVVVDEIDLHLHAAHQNEVLPELIGMFPNVQFVVTTHSPLFALGMHRALGEDGFAIYQLPEGQQITPEEFGEFGVAYKSFANSRRFAKDLKAALQEAKEPVLLPEGQIDMRYLQRAAQLLGEQETLGAFQLRDGGGAGNLTNIFNRFHAPLPELLQHPVVLLFDSDRNKPSKDNGRLYQRSIAAQPNNPIKTGIENLFGKTTLERAISDDNSLVDIEREHEARVGGYMQAIPERWTVDDGQKSRLCDWLCQFGDAGDFQAFNEVFDILAKVLKVDAAQWQEGPMPSGEVSGTDQESPADTRA